MNKTALLASCIVAGIAASSQVFVQAELASQEPLLSPGDSWTEFGLFNPAAIRVGRKTVLLFRAMDVKKTSRIGYAESNDGLHFTTRPAPVLQPEAAYEADGGVEDPRIVQIGGVYYLTYTGYNTRDAQLCLATSPDLIHWHREGVILPAYEGNWNTGWTKSGAIVPEKIKGKWWMYYLGTRKDPDGVPRDYMGIANSDDLIHWSDASPSPVLDRRPGGFDSRVMEPGPPPLLTNAGILLLYNGADEKLVYGPAWALVDRRNPERLIARASAPMLLPQLEWQRTGNVPNVIFIEGVVERARRLRRTGANVQEDIELTGYFGGADKFVGAMRIRVAVKSSP